MPDPALPEAGPVGTQPNLRRQYLDLLGRPMQGRATVRRTGQPQQQLSLEMMLTADGRLSLMLPPGDYQLQVMLTDDDDVRSFASEDIKIKKRGA